MLGKNKKYKGKKKNPKDHRNAIRQQSRAAASASNVATVAGATEIHNPSGSPGARSLISEASTTAPKKLVDTPSTLSSPVKPPSVFSLFPLAREIDNLSWELLHKCVICLFSLFHSRFLLVLRPHVILATYQPLTPFRKHGLTVIKLYWRS